MKDSPNGLHDLLALEPRLALDRAATELRAGRAIAATEPGRTTLLAALDGAAPSLFALFAAMPGAVLGLSAERARRLGLAGGAPAAIPLAGLRREAALRFAMAPHPDPAPSSGPGSIATQAGIALCKHGLLLPAVLAAPVEDAALPALIHRVTIGTMMAEPDDTPIALEIVSRAPVPVGGNIATEFVVFRGGPAPRDQVAVIVGKPDPARPVPARLHSSCLTGDLFGSLRCDCGDQLRNAIARLAAAGGGVLLYLDQEGRGIGIGNKMRSYALQDQGFDTIDADHVLGFGADERRYGYAAAMLAKLGFRRIVLLTNNPGKIDALRAAGIDVVARQPLTGTVTSQNLRYLHTKARRADHMLDELLGTQPADGVPGG
jgi:GTP cyclohydrolase II